MPDLEPRKIPKQSEKLSTIQMDTTDYEKNSAYNRVLHRHRQTIGFGNGRVRVPGLCHRPKSA